MQISPKAGPASVPFQTSNNTDARARAISILTGSQHGTPVNQNAVAPEDMTAVISASAKEEPETDDSANKHNSEPQHQDDQPQADPAAESAQEAATPESAKTAASEETPLSAQYAQLARKEKALRAQQQQLKAREEALRMKEQSASNPAQHQAKGPTLEDFQADLRKDPLGTLAKMGFTYDKLTEAALSQTSDPKELQYRQEMEALRAEIQELRAANEKTSKTFEEQQTQQYQQALKQLRSEAQALVDSNPEFETIKATGSVKDVVDLIEATWQKDGILLTPEQAAKEVEDYLVEEAIKLARLNKIQQRMKPVAPAKNPSAPSNAAKPQQSQQQMKTLTNSHAVSRPLTARERAMLAFKGENKA